VHDNESLIQVTIFRGEISGSSTSAARRPTSADVIPATRIRVSTGGIRLLAAPISVPAARAAVPTA
jgi:hypothetical protein